jgi:IS5 family transposase
MQELESTLLRTFSIATAPDFSLLRYRGLAKNTAQLKTLFALSNLWMVRHKLMGVGA